MQTCSRCGAHHADFLKFCPNDGTPLGRTLRDASLRRCPRCSAEFVGAIYCPHDGMPMVVVPETAPPGVERL